MNIFKNFILQGGLLLVTSAAAFAQLNLLATPSGSPQDRSLAVKILVGPCDPQGNPTRFLQDSETFDFPVAYFTYSPEKPMVGGNIEFDASDSYDFYGIIVSYEWDFGDGDTAQGEVVTHTYAQPGEYTVYLTVENDWGFTDTATSTLTIRLVIELSAKNNWDGKTISLTWSKDAGNVGIHRKKKTDGFEYIKTVSGTSYKDTAIPEPGKNYTYVLKNASGTAISNEATVKAEVIVVLVRGYEPFGTGYNADYWGEEVNSWFEDRGVTCWDASTYLNGTQTIAWNAAALGVFVNSKLSEAAYLTNPPTKINLVSHSMGGLISRQYANAHLGFVDRIFCVHTPHTGSILADIQGVLPHNPATDNLKPSFLKNTFNTKFRTTGGAQLYTLWSSNPGLSLEPLAKLISVDVRFFPGYSDGIVPTLSMFGLIWECKFLTLPKLSDPAIFSTDTAYTNYNHLVCYRKESTWSQILSWMGLNAGSTAMAQMELEGILDVNEPNVMPLYYIVGYEGRFDSNNPVSETAQISNSKKAYFRALVSDVNCSFTITDPCSIIYDPCYSSSQPNITYTDQNGVLMYDVNFPVAGSWTLSLSTTVSPPNSVAYGLAVFEDANITLYAYTIPDWANTDANVLILARLAENNNPIIDANITAEIVPPDTNIVSVFLYDDGLHNDVNAGDGVYANTFTSTAQTGIYIGQVTATGSSVYGGFERTSPLSFTISAPDINFTGDINEVGVDLNGNSLIDILEFIVPVNVSEANSFLLTATLSDNNDNIIKMLTTGEVNLPAGPNNLILRVSAEDIVRHDVNGPYKLSSITLCDVNGLITAVHPDCNSAAYSIDDFEPLDSDGDGLSDNLELLIGTDVNLPDSDFDGVTDYNEINFDGDANSYNPATDLNPLSPDTDNDGMSDGWEIYFDYDPLHDNGEKNNDNDSDGLTNLQEYQNNTDPNNNDTDFDGMPDGWEVSYGFNPVISDSSGDFDNDGMTNLEEYLTGHNPLVPDADGDFNHDRSVNILDLAVFCSHWLEQDCNDPNWCEGADINHSNTVNFTDFALLAKNWSPQTPAILTPDFDHDGDVDFNDLAVLVDQWLLEKLSADVAPGEGDGIVNFLDWVVFANDWSGDMNELADFSNQWLKSDTYSADIAPLPPDGIVNFLDYAVLAEHWLEGK
jgi:PKD repeat protein